MAAGKNGSRPATCSRAAPATDVEAGEAKFEQEDVCVATPSSFTDGGRCSRLRRALPAPTESPSEAGTEGGTNLHRAAPASIRIYVRIYAVLSVFLMLSTSLSAASSIHEFTLKSIDGQPTPLARFKGKVTLIVNVASRCGFTSQYAGLEALYKKYKDKGLVVLGFPANDFLWQEPGTNDEIKAFCSTKYGVTFPMFAKVSVKGRNQAPLYQFLTDKTANPSTGGSVSWNFTKFLADRNGKVIARFGSRVAPESAELVKAIEAALSSR